MIPAPKGYAPRTKRGLPTTPSAPAGAITPPAPAKPVLPRVTPANLPRPNRNPVATQAKGYAARARRKLANF